MNVKGIDHIAINAKNFKETVRFYRDVLGFRELNTVVQPDFSAVYLQIPGGPRMEIFDNMGSTKDRCLNDLDAGVKHIAFRVENVKKHEEILIQNGVDVFFETTELPDFKARVILFHDPNGIVVEFCEPLV